MLRQIGFAITFFFQTQLDQNFLILCSRVDEFDGFSLPGPPEAFLQQISHIRLAQVTTGTQL
jgi:hypothetical protein